jgi:bifunctional DNase/RNase
MAENFVEMELREIHLSEDALRPQMIVLGEKEGEKSFPIYIGLPEAQALDAAVRGKRFPRPLTHDLILNILEGLQVHLLRVLVVKLEEDTFYGALELQRPTGEVVRIDSRPSDAIVLAMKCRTPIFVAQQVLDEVGRVVEQNEEEEDVFESDEDLGEEEEPENPDE